MQSTQACHLMISVRHMTGMYNNAKTMGGRLCLGRFFLEVKAQLMRPSEVETL